MKIETIVTILAALAGACIIFILSASFKKIESQQKELLKLSSREIGTNFAPPSLPSLEKLMPKFEVRSNAPSNFQIAFMAYNETNWTLVDGKYATPDDAEIIILKTKVQLLENAWNVLRLTN